jgi:cytochrome P450
VNAGSDTTAIALTHALYYLLKNPDKLYKLREELDTCLGDDNTIPAYAAVKNVAYLRACLDESLRLSPPVSFGLERKTPSEGTSISGKWIAGDTLVSVPAYLAHRDPSIFPDPEKYMPERWITEESRTVQKYFIPFSTGARGCIGRNISYIEQHVLLASLLRRYEFALPHPEWELQWEERFNLWPCAMPLRLWRRSK